jgi:phosphatidate phosphatase APP1
MSFTGTATRWKKAANRILSLLARPVRTAAHGKAGLVLQPYRGYGSRSEVFLIGRVFRQSRPQHGGPARKDLIVTHLRDIGRRVARRAVADAVITARFCGAECRVATDRDGYFRVHLRPRDPPPSDRAWQAMELVLEQPDPVRAHAEIFIPPEHSRYVVISDIDDTVMYTGVANKLKMLWRLFVQTAESRVAFPGVAALYRALHLGVSGDERNAMLYVSRAPWGIYDILEEFFAAHRIPVGPVLFLREWGISWKRPLPRRATDHKQELIGNMLRLYSDLPFVLIGDSGQHDPEVYRHVVEEHPGRVIAVFIRDVSSRDARRRQEIEELAVAVTAAGSSLLLSADSFAMAEHAANLGLIAREALPVVRSEMARAAAADGGDTYGVAATFDVNAAAACADNEAAAAKAGQPPAGAAAAHDQEEQVSSLTIGRPIAKPSRFSMSSKDLAGR